MNKRGVIGQILTSFPVLIMVVFIMILFLVIAFAISGITGGAGKVGADGVVSEDYDISSRVLAELFLGDYVVIDGDEMIVKDAIKQLGDEESGEKKLEIAGAIQGGFDEGYGCGGKNKMILTGINRFAEIVAGGEGYVESAIVYINYPETMKKLEFKNYNLEGEDSLYTLFDDGGYTFNYELPNSRVLSLFIKEVAKC